MSNIVRHSDPVPAVVEQVRARPSYSRATVAHLNDVSDKLVEAKRSMLNDMSKRPFESAEEAGKAILELQSLEKRISEIKERVNIQSDKEFDKEDVLLMERMKKEGKTEDKIASLFETNQTRINRMLNGKIKL